MLSNHDILDINLPILAIALQEAATWVSLLFVVAWAFGLWHALGSVLHHTIGAEAALNAFRGTSGLNLSLIRAQTFTGLLAHRATCLIDHAVFALHS